jgi:ParB/RepB/Spo0J family partition protein
MPEMQILDFDPAQCLAPDDNRPAERPNLAEGIRANGQLVPGLLCPHPDVADRYLILDGVGRWFACGRLGIMFRAMLLPEAVPEAERIRLRLQHNVIRRNMTPDEIADDATRYIRITNCSQEAAAKQLTLSPATLSRAMSVHRRIPLELKAKAEAVRPSIAAMIAALPTIEAMRTGLDYATSPGKDGRLPTRDQVGFYVDQFKVRKPRGTKAKTLKGMVEGRKVELGLLPDESTESVIRFLQSLAAKIGKYRDLPPDNLGFLFNGLAAARPVEASS